VNRLCERPGCSAPADVAYGFDAERLSMWLDALVTVPTMRHGVLCRRHADAMIVPLGWMLDDRREPTLRLFKAPATDAPRPQPRRDRRARDDTGEQLRLDAALLARVDEDTGGPAEQPAVADDLPAASTVATDEAAGTAAETETGSDSPEPLPADRRGCPCSTRPTTCTASSTRVAASCRVRSTARRSTRADRLG
jgi:hypothetical protein